MPSSTGLPGPPYFQFSIRDLLIWTTLVALAVAGVLSVPTRIVPVVTAVPALSALAILLATLDNLDVRQVSLRQQVLAALLLFMFAEFLLVGMYYVTRF